MIHLVPYHPLRRFVLLAGCLLLVLAIWPCAADDEAPLITCRIDRTTVRISYPRRVPPYWWVADVDTGYSLTAPMTGRLQTPYLIVHSLAEDSNGQRWYFAFVENKGYYELIECRLPDPANRSQDQVETDVASLKRIRRSVKGLPLAFENRNKPRVIAWRVEVWHSGALAAHKNSCPELQLTRMGLPDDWYVFDKHPEKIHYRTKK